MKDDSSKVEAEKERLKDISWKTSKARFNASERLIKKQRSLVFLIIMFTVVQIGMSVLLITLDNNENILSKFLSTISIVLSVFVALISNTESITKNALNAHLLHKCGVDLNALNKEISILDPCSKKDIMSMSKKYHNIISECNLNHNKIDYDKVSNDIRETHPFIKIINNIHYFLRTYDLFLIYLISAFIFCSLFLLFYNIKITWLEARLLSFMPFF